MDCQRTKVNQVCKDYKITKFPTLKFFPTNSDTMYTYTGETTADAMHKFIDNEMWKDLEADFLPGINKRVIKPEVVHDEL